MSNLIKNAMQEYPDIRESLDTLSNQPQTTLAVLDIVLHSFLSSEEADDKELREEVSWTLMHLKRVALQVSNEVNNCNKL